MVPKNSGAPAGGRPAIPRPAGLSAASPRRRRASPSCRLAGFPLQSLARIPFLRKGPRGSLLVLAAALAALPAFAQDAPAAPAPEFALIGDATQKTAYSAGAWDQWPTAAWSFTSDLKPKFTYGPVRFQADTTWTLPLTASLAAGVPTVSVTEAYFRVSPTDSLDLTYGQKRFSIGVGQTFTVGDSINPVIGFFDQKTGFRGADAEWSPVSWASFSAAYSTEGGVDKPAGVGQVALLLDKVQLTGSLSAQKDKSFNPALGASYDLVGVILTAEGAVEFLPQGLRPSGPASTWAVPAAWSAPAASGSMGARWTVSLGDVDVTLAGEYLHWAQGFTADETTAWKTALSGASAPAAAAARQATHGVRGQENAFLRASAVSGTEYAVAGFAALDLQDRSILGQGTVTWAPWDNFELDLNLQAAGGDPGSAWEFLDPTAKTRYQASFSTTYHF